MTRKATSIASVTTIDDLNNFRVGDVFEGDVIVVYKTIVQKEQGKQLLRANVIDVKAEMTITLDVANKFTPMHEEKNVAGKGIRITNFNIAPKTSYDRGDNNMILLLNQSSTIESIPPICIEYKFIPNSTVKQLLNNIEQYATRTIAAIVTSAKKLAYNSSYKLKMARQKKTQRGFTFSEPLRLFLKQ